MECKFLNIVVVFYLLEAACSSSDSWIGFAIISYPTTSTFLTSPALLTESTNSSSIFKRTSRLKVFIADSSFDPGT